LKIVESNYHALILAKRSGKYRLRSKRFLWLYITRWLGMRVEVQTFDISDDIKNIELETKDIKQILQGREAKQ